MFLGTLTSQLSGGGTDGIGIGRLLSHALPHKCLFDRQWQQLPPIQKRTWHVLCTSPVVWSVSSKSGILLFNVTITFSVTIIPWYTISGNPEVKNMDLWVLDDAYAESWVNFIFYSTICSFCHGPTIVTLSVKHWALTCLPHPSFLPSLVSFLSDMEWIAQRPASGQSCRQNFIPRYPELEVLIRFRYDSWGLWMCVELGESRRIGIKKEI